MNNLVDIDLNEYFLQTPIAELLAAVSNLKDRNQSGDAPFVSGSSEAVRQSEKDLLDIVSRICKTKGVISDECLKVRQNIVQAVSTQPAEPRKTSDEPLANEDPDCDWNQRFHACLDHGDLLTATLLQQKVNTSSSDLRSRLLNQETCFATAYTRLGWDILPLNVLHNCFLSLALMLPSVSPSSILNHIVDQRLQVIDRLLLQVQDTKHSQNISHIHALRLSLTLSLITHLEGLAKFPRSLGLLTQQLLDRSSLLVNVDRHTCHCKARQEHLQIDTAHPTILYQENGGSTEDAPLVFTHSKASVCSLQCISSIEISVESEARLQRSCDQLKAAAQSYLPAHDHSMPRDYSDIHSFYTLVLLLLMEWSDNSMLGTPWEPFRASLPCLQHALRHCPSIHRLKGILEAVQDKELLASLSHPVDIVGIEQTINVLRAQYLTTMSSFVSVQTKAELMSDAVALSRCDRIAHHFFLNFWRSMETQMRIRDSGVLDLIRISDYELKDRLVTSLTEELKQLTSSNLELNHFHFLWILMRHQDESTTSVRQALLSEFLDSFWTEDLRINCKNMSSLQKETAVIANRLFTWIPPPNVATPTTTTTKVWRHEEVLWIIELILREILPILTRSWRVPVKSGGIQQCEEWYDIIRLGFLKRITEILKDEAWPSPSSVEFIRALFANILDEQPQIVESTHLLFTLSLELGQLLNALSVNTEIRAQADELAGAIITLIQPFVGRDMRLKIRASDAVSPQVPSGEMKQPKFFRKLPIVRRVPLKPATSEIGHPGTIQPQVSPVDGSFSLSQLLTVRPAFTSAFGALWDNVISK